MKEYYYMKISKTPIIIWIIVALFLTGGLLLIVPLCMHFIYKNSKYYYNDEKFIIEKGVFNKEQRIIPLYRIVNLKAQQNIFNYGNINIEDKGQIITLKYVERPKEEMLKLIDKWESAKKQNIRNEVI